MNKGIIILLFLFLYASRLAAQADSPFRVVFWNTENLFNTHHDSLKNDYEFLPDALRHWNYSKYKKKLVNVARGITAVGEWNPPVLVGLCEIENDSVMLDLVRYSPLKEHGYRYVMTHSPDERGIDVALLYQRDRFKLLFHRSISVGTFNSHRPTRDILHVCGLLSTGDSLDVFVVHLPSRSGGAKASEPYRLFVAKKIRSEADSILASRIHPQLIIMGDFNDYPENKSIKEVLAAIAPPHHPIPLKLYHLLARKAKADKYKFGSYKYQGEWGLLDHLIVSGTLLDTSSPFYTNEKKANVARLPFLMTDDDKYGGQQPFRTYYGMKYLGGYSDHLPVYVDFEIR
ncbi:endonuclease/exonuclease/phosphatase family protein [Bacteroides sp.]